MKNVLIIFSMVLLISSCGTDTVFKKYNKMENVNWRRFDNQEFSFQVEKDTKMDFFFALRHHTNYPYDHISFTVSIKTPDGETRSRGYTFKLKDKTKKWKGDGMGQLWDIDLLLRKETVFKKSGVCQVSIENNMPKMDTPGIIEIGLVIRKSE